MVSIASNHNRYCARFTTIKALNAFSPRSGDRTSCTEILIGFVREEEKLAKLINGLLPNFSTITSLPRRQWGLDAHFVFVGKFIHLSSRPAIELRALHKRRNDEQIT